MTKATERGGGLALLALILSNVALAFGPLFVRMADTGPVSAGFWRLSLALPVLVLIAMQRREPLSGFRPGIWWMLALGGFAFALDLASWNFGIERTKLANATLFGNMGSILLVLYGFVISRAWPHKAEAGAVLLAIIGASLLMGSSYELDVRNLVGDLFCLAAGVLYVVYLLSIRHVRNDLGSWSVLVWSTVFGIGPLLGIALLLGEPVWPTDWTPVLLLAVVCQLFGGGAGHRLARPAGDRVHHRLGGVRRDLVAGGLDRHDRDRHRAGAGAPSRGTPRRATCRFGSGFLIGSGP
jgi:drug/metabolite transporter (DMT)-like permease